MSQSYFLSRGHCEHGDFCNYLEMISEVCCGLRRMFLRSSSFMSSTGEETITESPCDCWKKAIVNTPGFFLLGYREGLSPYSVLITLKLSASSNYVENHSFSHNLISETNSLLLWDMLANLVPLGLDGKLGLFCINNRIYLQFNPY